MSQSAHHMPKTLQALQRLLDSRFNKILRKKTFWIHIIPPDFPHQDLRLGIQKKFSHILESEEKQKPKPKTKKNKKPNRIPD